MSDERLPGEEIPPETIEQQWAQLAYWNALSVSQVITVGIATAARYHPEELRKALAGVFDLSVWEKRAAEYVERIHGLDEMARKAEKHLYDLRAACQAIHDDIERLGYRRKKLLEAASNNDRKWHGG